MDDRTAGRQHGWVLNGDEPRETMDRRDDTRDHRLRNPCDDRDRSAPEFSRTSLDQDTLVRIAGQLLNAERTICEHFPSVRRVDVSWAILLALFASQGDKRMLDVTNLCVAVPPPTATVLRRIEHLHRLGFISRSPDQTDRRRTFLALESVALKATESCLHAITKIQGLGGIEPY